MDNEVLKVLFNNSNKIVYKNSLIMSEDVY